MNFRLLLPGFFPIFCISALAPLHAMEPEVVEWLPGNETNTSLDAGWADSIRTSGGEHRGEFWTVESQSPVGRGRIDLALSGNQRPHALAITLAMDEAEGSDLALQLYNSLGELVAVDLFGNLAESAHAGRSDTFIVPLSKYPTATVVSLRRITGPVAIRGFVAFPVITALDELPQNQREEFAEVLGETLASSQSAAGGGSARIREVDDDEILERLLADPSYPDATFQGTFPATEAFAAYVSGTCYRFFTNLYLPFFNNPDEAEKLAFVASSTSVHALLNGRTNIALASYPPRQEQLEEFEQANGFRPLVIPIARDAVEVLVHPRNQFNSMDFATLARIFSDDGRNNSRHLYWDRESGLRGPILVAGGAPHWGTSRFFADKVMNGASFTSKMSYHDVAYSHGVERFVSENLNAIGFAQHTRRNFPVKALAVGPDVSSATVANAATVAAGSYPLTRHLYLLLGYKSASDIPEPELKFADRLLSREGQRAVAEVGSFALSAEEVLASRRQLGL